MALRKGNSGFTLIELVVVIVILGILAATALPKFIDMSGNARSATAQALVGSLYSTEGLVNAAWAAQGGNGVSNVTMADGTVVTVNPATGYPTSAATGIGAAIGCTVSGTVCNGYMPNFSPLVTTFYPVGAPTPANCLVKYTPAGLVTLPSTSGC